MIIERWAVIKKDTGEVTKTYPMEFDMSFIKEETHAILKLKGEYTPPNNKIIRIKDFWIKDSQMRSLTIFGEIDLSTIYDPENGYTNKITISYEVEE